MEGFPGGSVGKVSAGNAGGPGSIPGLGRSPGEGHHNPLQYSCLENPMDRAVWWATAHGGRKGREVDGKRIFGAGMMNSSKLAPLLSSDAFHY